MKPLPHVFVALLILLALPAMAAPEPERADATWRHGVIWRAAPLASGFPLVVKSPAGLALSLALEDEATGGVALTAGIEGGRMFRILAPNGSFIVTLDYAPATASGDGPGDDADRLRIEPALRFGVTGVARKQGHVVTLSETAGGLEVAIKGQALCQRVSVVFTGPVELPAAVTPLDDSPPAPGTALVDPRAQPFDPLIEREDFERRIRTVVCD